MAHPALHKAAKQVRADQNATTQASRLSWQELARRREFIQLVVFSKRTKKSKSALQKYITTHEAAEIGVVREGLVFNYKPNQHCSFSPSFSMYFVHACGVRVVFLHGALTLVQLVSLHLKS